MADLRDVEAARRHVGGDQIGDLAVAERLERLQPRELIHVAMKCRGIEAVLLERGFEDRHGGLAVGEDDGVLDVVVFAQQAPQRVALLLVIRWRIDRLLDDGGRRGGRRGGLDLDRIVEELVGEALDFRRHGGREEQRLTGDRQDLADTLDIGMKPMSSIRSASSTTSTSMPCSMSLPRST